MSKKEDLLLFLVRRLGMDKKTEAQVSGSNLDG